MVRGEGFAPSTAGCKPAVILFHQPRVLKNGVPGLSCTDTTTFAGLRAVYYTTGQKLVDLAGIAPAARWLRASRSATELQVHGAACRFRPDARCLECVTRKRR